MITHPKFKIVKLERIKEKYNLIDKLFKNLPLLFISIISFLASSIIGQNDMICNCASTCVGCINVSWFELGLCALPLAMILNSIIFFIWFLWRMIR
jgi:hypothetical protein